MTQTYELSEHFAKLRAISAEAAAVVDQIEALLKDCWIDSYYRPCEDTCRCALSGMWEPNDRLSEAAREQHPDAGKLTAGLLTTGLIKTEWTLEP